MQRSFLGTALTSSRTKKAPSDRVTGYLLDVNVLLALAWPNHQFHAVARHWLQKTGRNQGWSTCAVTELGFIRLSSNPVYTPYAKRPMEAVRLLTDLTTLPGHKFVGALVSASSEPFLSIASKLHGHRQTTDAYLVALATVSSLRLATFDRRMEWLSSSNVIEVLRA